MAIPNFSAVEAASDTQALLERGEIEYIILERQGNVARPERARGRRWGSYSEAIGGDVYVRILAVTFK